MSRKPIVPLPSGCVCRNEKCTVPYGLCHCGCGETTKISKQSNSTFGHVKGKPVQFLVGHNHRKNRPPVTYGEVDGEPVVFIPMTKNLTVIVDRFNEDKVKGVWCPSSTNPQKAYASRRVGKKIVLMHKILAGFPEDVQVDHHNRNKLDNRVSNFRIANQEEQSRNANISSNNTSGVKGVGFHKASGKNVAYIRYGGKHIHLGLFDKKDDAIEARERKELELFGEFARDEIKEKWGFKPIPVDSASL